MLALDTASTSGGVALVRGRAVLGEESWQVGGQQTSEVLPAAVRLWERAGITAADLDAVAVSAGPGSYTGLRVGFSLAKGMALARGLPVVAMPTLEAVAYQHRERRGSPLRCGGRRQGQLYVARFERRAGGGVGGSSRRAGRGDPGSEARWPCSPRTSWPGAWRQSGAPCSSVASSTRA